MIGMGSAQAWTMLSVEEEAAGGENVEIYFYNLYIARVWAEYGPE